MSHHMYSIFINKIVNKNVLRRLINNFFEVHVIGNLKDHSCQYTNVLDPHTTFCQYPLKMACCPLD